ncbi:MerR family transcriptional regulator [Solibacillus sp. FSL R7-0682]|jgi:DNA-binding transcriptional MerR regulator|uniref:MerR family transcriptional regulator n=1 Tax=Solibacillus sp. FSL R7-0682 TaxID=2921690 RepID=UPI0030FB5564
MITIKDISKRTGISVRTLRYYEEIALLIPSAKTEGGHRLYGEEELKKLQQILFLKNLGFKLKEIQTLLNKTWNWSASIEHQLAFVKEEQEKLKQMENTLIGLKNALAIEGELTEALIQQMIQLSLREQDQKQAFRKQLFADSEMDLIKKLPNINRNDPHSLEWVALLGQLKQEVSHGAESAEVQRIIKRMVEKSEEAYKDNDLFLEKMWEIRKSPSLSEQAGLYPLDNDFINFIEQAYTIYEARKEAGQL